MKVLVLGGDGMLGHKVVEVLSRRFETAATFVDPQGPWREFPQYAGLPGERLLGGVDALRFATVAAAIERVRPDAVINCVGIIKQVKEASDAVLTITLNSLLPHRLAEACAVSGARLVHISTDCVFSGRKGSAYGEDDLPDPEDLYGRSKLLGELDRPGCLTVRTSIFGRDYLKQSALLEWFLSNRGGRVRGYRNAIYSGFPTQVLARIIGDVLADHPSLSGLVQIASLPISKYDLLVKLREAMALDIEIEPFDDPPCDRSLSAARFEAATGYAIPAWDEMLAEVAADPAPYDEWRLAHVSA
ncbi:MAG: SDR family oxidoreductase [Thermoleophilia bacterium]